MFPVFWGIVGSTRATWKIGSMADEDTPRVRIALVADTPASQERSGADWPWATLVISAAILLVFVAENLLGLEEPDVATTLLRVGGLDYGSVFEGGEWWRLLAAAFAHLGLPHVLLNGWALIQLGALIEDVWGRERFLIVYLLSCIGGSLASASVGLGLSVGASTGIMGLIGFLLGARYVQEPEIRSFLRAVLGRQLIFWTVFILGVGGLLSVVNEIQPIGLRVDNCGHVGGLATGMLLSFVLRAHGRAGIAERAAAALLVCAAAVSLAAAATRGDESARIRKALEDTEVALAKNDVAAITTALATLDDIPGARRRAVGHRVEYAQLLVSASVASQRTADALAYGQLAVELDPVRGSTILAQAQLAAGDEAAAHAALDKYRAEASATDLRKIGFALEQQGRSALAIWFFEAAYDREPVSPDVLNELAWTLVTAKDTKVRDPQRALGFARRAVALGAATSGAPMYLDTLAETEFQLGLPHEALAHEEQAVKLAPTEEQLLEHLEKYRNAAR
jgi:membrane associated rhomboid family serine protease